MAKRTKSQPTIGDKVVLLKTGWSDFYNGGPVTGNYRYVQKRGPSSGHEKYNFARYGQQYNGYCPPKCPKPIERSGWTVIWVAKKPGTAGVRVIGVYFNATFIEDYALYQVGSEQIYYCVVGRSALLVPPKLRSETFRSPIKSGSCCYLKAPGVPASRYGRLLRQLSRFVERIQAQPASETAMDDELPDFPGSEHRKKVEKAAVRYVKRRYRAQGYRIGDFQDRRDLGYDLEATRQEKKLKLEVKGVTGDVPYAYITANEVTVAKRDGDGSWKLCLVLNALEGRRSLKEYNREEFFRTFSVDPVCYRATQKKAR